MRAPEVVFRDAIIDDLPRIVDIYNSTVASRMVTADTQTVTPDSRLKWFNEHNAERPLWVVEKRGEAGVIGWVSFQSFYGRPAYRHTVEISIYLDEEVRGQGFGKRVLEESISRARDADIKTLHGFMRTDTGRLRLRRHQIKIFPFILMLRLTVKLEEMRGAQLSVGQET